ncbi:MAG: ABC transporter substrate-binding protein [Thermostichus sp. DG02_5_bins_236]
MFRRHAVVVGASAALLGSLWYPSQTQAQAPVEINFYYPTAVGGPLTQIIDGYAANFSQANPDIKVNAIYAGGYDDIYKAVQTQISGGGSGPDVAIFLSVDMYSLIDNDYILPLNDFIASSSDGKAMIDDFFPAFMLNSQDDESTVWGIPFQRSTPVLYYNRDLFKTAGLPDRAPETVEEMREFATKLTDPSDGVWGLMIPSDGFPYWLFQGFAIGNGQNIVGEAANQVFFNTPAVVSGLQYMVELSSEAKVMPAGVIKWGDTPTTFTSGKAAMIYHTTGSLTNILNNADFEVGVGYLPKGSVGYGAPTGGGNLHILSTTPPEKREAAWRWIEYLASPEIQADWGVGTGYIAARQSSWNLDPLKSLAAEKPQYAVARDQLQFAQKELATHQGLDIRQIFGKAVQAAITGEKDAKTALDEAQTQAERILADYGG